MSSKIDQMEEVRDQLQKDLAKSDFESNLISLLALMSDGQIEVYHAIKEIRDVQEGLREAYRRIQSKLDNLERLIIDEERRA